VFTLSSPSPVHRQSQGRRLDALTVEAALNGRRPYRELPPAEAVEVMRILRRRGTTLDQVAARLDVDAHVIAERYADVGAR
jgi:hypothetical protein